MATTLEVQRNNITWVVSYKDTWAGEWVSDKWLMPESVGFSLAPDIPTALIVRDFAVMHELSIGAGTTSVSTVEPLDLTGKYIKVALSQVQNAGGVKNWNWYGYCPAPVDQYMGERPVNGSNVNTGRTTYNCFGLEWLLKDTKVIQSSVRTDEAAVEIIEQTISYNFVATKRQWELVGNRSTDQVSGVYHFSPDETNQWTGLTVLEHLLYQWSLQTGEKLTWEIEGGNDLDNVQNAWDFAGQTYYQAISNIVNSTTGFVWSVEVSSGGNPVIKVQSAFEDDIKDENDAVIVTGQGFTTGLNIGTDPAVSRCIVKQLDTSVYDRVEVRGAPSRVCFTVAMEDGVIWPDNYLVDGWTAAQKLAYDNADDDARILDDVASVYNRFVLPTDWNLESFGEIAIPQIDITTGEFAEPATKGNIYLRNKVYDRTLPWKEIDNDSQFRRPFLIYQDEDGNWHMVDRPRKNVDDTDFSSVGLKVLDDRLGLHLEPGSKPNHIVALNHFLKDDSEDPAEWDYSTSLATVSMYTDDVARVNLIVAGTGEQGENTRTKIINMPWCELWYVIPGTVKSYDSTKQGAAALVKQEEGLYTRNDSDKLRRAASLARQWYGKKSQVMELDYGSPFLDQDTIALGGIIGDLNSGEITEAINTIVSSMTYSLREKSQELKLKTSFIELDIARLLRPGRASGTGPRRFQPSPMHDELANIPVRQGVAAPSAVALYDGEFAIVIGGVGIVVASGDVVAGYTRTAYAGGESTISAGDLNYIYIKVTYTDSYQITLVVATAKQTNAEGTYYRLIGTEENGTIVQYQHGEIEVIGRYVT